MISIIVPVYNVQEYIDRCISSLINQTYKDLEIILVDDGSTDRSGAICDAYALKDSRIKIIHQENRGLSVARNNGLNASAGEWIAFLDSDDWVEKNMYELLFDLAEKYGAEISCCSTRLHFDERVQADNIFDDKVSVMKQEQIIENLFFGSEVRFEVWNKLWSRKIVGDIRFIENQVSEDIYFDRIAFLKVNKMVFINTPLHNYVVGRPGSTISSFKRGRIGALKELERFLDDCEARGFEKASNALRCFSLEFIVNMYIQAFEDKQDDDILKLLEEYYSFFYKREIIKMYPNIGRRMNVIFSSISPKLMLTIRNIKKKLYR